MGIFRRLFGAKQKESGLPETQKTPTLAQPTQIDWRNSRAHLLLLTKFQKPQEISSFTQKEYWNDVLGETMLAAIERLNTDGMLVQVNNLGEKMSYKFRVVDLKPILQEKRLKVSGRKADLIVRLIEVDEEGMELAVSDVHLVKCSEEGEKLANQYLEETKREREEAEQAVATLLQTGDYRGASRAMANYESKQVFSRGESIDWNNYSTVTDERILLHIFAGKPKILKKLTDDQLSQLRIPAALMYLWGEARSNQWLPSDLELGLNFDAETAARMLLFYAQNQADLEQYAPDDHKLRFEILATDNSCDACKKMAKRTYTLSSIPELPYEKCTCEMGCRCTAMLTIDSIMNL